MLTFVEIINWALPARRADSRFPFHGMGPCAVDHLVHVRLGALLCLTARRNGNVAPEDESFREVNVYKSEPCRVLQELQCFGVNLTAVTSAFDLSEEGFAGSICIYLSHLQA
jgi:hypothetical protein